MPGPGPACPIGAPSPSRRTVGIAGRGPPSLPRLDEPPGSVPATPDAERAIKGSAPDEVGFTVALPGSSDSAPGRSPSSDREVSSRLAIEGTASAAETSDRWIPGITGASRTGTTRGAIGVGRPVGSDGSGTGLVGGIASAWMGRATCRWTNSGPGATDSTGVAVSPIVPAGASGPTSCPSGASICVGVLRSCTSATNAPAGAVRGIATSAVRWIGGSDVHAGETVGATRAAPRSAECSVGRTSSVGSRRRNGQRTATPVQTAGG